MSAFVDELGDPALTFERAALLVGRELEPTLDVGVAVRQLDGFARAYVPPSDHSAEGQAVALCRLLGDQLGFRGNSTDYYAPENSLLDRVVERRLGIPITLAIVYIAVGARVGVEVQGIGFPGHFIARVGGEAGVYVDPFHRGALLDDSKLQELASEFIGPGAEPSRSHLASVSPRAVAVRMLSNLEAAYARRAEHALAWVAADRAHGITGDAIFLRNRGLHASAMGSHALAIGDLEAYLDAQPTAGDARRIRALLDRSRKVPVRGAPN